MLIRKILVKISVFILSELIHFELKFKKKKYIYPPFNNFGDILEFYMDSYKKIISSKKKLLVFSSVDERVAIFFFNKKKIQKNFFFLKNLSSYRIFYKLYLEKDRKNIFPIFKIKDRNKYIFKTKKRNFYRNLFVQKLENEKISNKLKKVSEKKYITFFWKYYNDNPNDLSGSSTRSTTNLNKILNLLNFLKRKFNIIIVGEKIDKGNKILKNKLKADNKIFFLHDLSKNYSLADQIYCYKNSEGFIGNASVMITINWVLKKKVIIFDTLKEMLDNRFRKHTTWLYKKYTTRKISKPRVLELKLLKKLDSIEYKIIENKLSDIKKEFNNKFIN